MAKRIIHSSLDLDISAFRNKLTEAEKLISGMSKKVDGGTASFGNMTSAASKFGSTLGMALQGAAVASFAANIGKSVVQMERLNIAMQNITASFGGYASSQSYINQLTDKYGQSLVQTSRTYNQFIASSNNANLTLQERQTIFGSLIKAGSSLALSDYAVEKSLYAVNQMFSKGTVQAEELRQQLGDHLPGALSLMAEALGVTEKELMSLMKKGLVPADEALLKFSEKLEYVFGATAERNIETMSGAMNRLQNNIIKASVSLNEKYEITKKVAEIINHIADNLEDYSSAMAAVVAGVVAYKVTSMAAAAATTLWTKYNITATSVEIGKLSAMAGSTAAATAATAATSALSTATASATTATTALSAATTWTTTATGSLAAATTRTAATTSAMAASATTATVATTALTAATVRATSVTAIFNTVMMAAPWVAAAAAVAYFATQINRYESAAEKAAKTQEELATFTKTYTSDVTAKQQKLQGLASILSDTNTLEETKNKALAQANLLFPDTFKNLKTYAGNEAEIKKAIDKTNVSLEQRIKLMQAQASYEFDNNAVTQMVSDLEKLRRDRENLKPGDRTFVPRYLGVGANAAVGLATGKLIPTDQILTSKIEAGNKEVERLVKQRDEKLKALMSMDGSSSLFGTGPRGGGGGLGGDDEEGNKLKGLAGKLDTLAKKYEKVKKEVSEISDEYSLAIGQMSVMGKMESYYEMQEGFLESNKKIAERYSKMQTSAGTGAGFGPNQSLDEEIQSS